MFKYIMRNPEEFELRERLINIDEELELLDYDDMEYEKRAEKQFKQHQKELKRYYDINIEQLKLVFPLGIITMLLGFAIIFMTIYLCKEMLSSIPIIIGCISGLLVDLIGAIFIKMYVETVKTSTEFHKKLIGSNNNLFANVLITKINDEKLKNETFAETAKIIANIYCSELKSLK